MQSKSNDNAVATTDTRGLNVGYEDRDFSGSDEETEHDHHEIDEFARRDVARRPLSRKIPIPSSKINPYRMVILMRVIAIGAFFYFRLRNPVRNGYVLWLISVICEIWFALSWLLDQIPKWFPINRETYRRRLALRYNKNAESSQLAFIDIVITTVDPAKEHPIVTANCVLSVLAVDYPVDKVSCYVSDDGASFLTFEALHETSELAKKWVPFCKKHGIEPRAPEWYFSQKVDYLQNKVHASFVKDRRAMKRNYEEFKVRINALVAKARKVPNEGWVMQDGTPWPGNRTNDHPGMIQVILGQYEEHDDDESEKLPRLVYVSREKRPGFRHHNKAGAMNALVRVSGLLTNGPFLLNLNCSHYISNSKILQEAMCFLMDPNHEKSLCFVQFPLRFDGIDTDDLYANRNTAFFDINLRALDGIQGPTYIGTGCVFNRRALYGCEAPINPKRKLRCGILSRCFGFGGSHGSTKPETKDCESEYTFEGEGYIDETSELVSHMSLEKCFGQSNVFIESMLLEESDVSQPLTGASLLKEAIQVISCGYEDGTRWGNEIGWIYGSGSEDFLTGLKMHARGWRSVYCMPKSPAFKGSAPTSLADRLHQVLSWAQGSVRILLSRHCPIWYALGGRLKWLQRLAYINSTVYPLTSIPLTVYCSLPAICLFSGKFIFPQVSMPSSIILLSLFLSILATNILEMRWSGVGINEWWRNEQFWVIGSVSAHLFAIFQGLFKSIPNININFHYSSHNIDEFPNRYALKWTSLLIPPTTLLMINLIGLLVGFSSFVDSNSQIWSLLFCKMFFALWVIIHLYPFLKGLTSQQNKVPTIVVVWSILLASIFSLLWVNVNPFMSRVRGPSSEQCGINC